MSKKQVQKIKEVKKVTSQQTLKGKRVVLTIQLPGALEGCISYQKHPNWNRRTKPCHLRRTISQEAVEYLTSEASFVYPFSSKSWKALSPMQRLNAHFLAEAGSNEYSFAIID